MGEGSKSRPGIVLWSALAVEVAALAGAFALADTTALAPTWGILDNPLVALVGVLLAVAALVTALERRNVAAAWRAAASGILALAFGILLVTAGRGTWFVCCVVALPASWVATLVAFRGPGRPSPRPARAATAVAVAALAGAIWSGAGSVEDADYAGTWSASGDTALLTMSDLERPHGDGQYTLRVGTCTENGTWAFDYPQMSFSTQVWLRRGGAMCLQGRQEILVRIVGGTEAAPVIGLPGPNDTELRFTKR
ncbi:hypothetical protein ABZ128_10885 [Streptomyces sp. NPDC006326]|uniref:hypothetical protein n=1 Tax=Streptomyces sp. NPDC006326 TaxID=3156752 RepID=UPI0033BD558C